MGEHGELASMDHFIEATLKIQGGLECDTEYDTE